jgi:hypothetical protein
MDDHWLADLGQVVRADDAAVAEEYRVTLERVA